MNLWLSILAVTMASWVMKASGPLALGDRHLPATGVNIISLMAPVLLTGLLVVELAGPGWGEFDWPQLAGVGTAGLTRAVKAPMLLALVCGITVTALIRAKLS